MSNRIGEFLTNTLLSLLCLHGKLERYKYDICHMLVREELCECLLKRKRSSVVVLIKLLTLKEELEAYRENVIRKIVVNSLLHW